MANEVDSRETAEQSEAVTDSFSGAVRGRVEILSGSRRDQLVELTIGQPARIGCDTECEVWFAPDREPFVSSHHAELLVTPQEAVIRDSQSKNGTYINGEALDGSRRLYCGDVIELGYGGPRMRLETEGENLVRSLTGRSTVMLQSTKRQRPASEESSAPRRRWPNPIVLAAACVLTFMLTAALYREGETSSRQSEEIAELQMTLERVRQAGPSLARRFGKAIFLVALRVKAEGFAIRGQKVPVGILQPGGTAWAYDKSGRLVTNAHVYQRATELAERYPDYIEVVCVQNETGVIYRVTDAEVHPHATLEDGFRFLVSDVALLQLDGKVSVVLPIASRERCLDVSSGLAVYSIGFPVEMVGKLGAFYGYESPDKVVATIRHGTVQRITTSDGSMGEVADARLVHVGIPAVGGQSGSPVLTADGTVVSMLLATGLYQVAPSGPRLPHPGMFTYSLRADSVLDMLEDRVPALEEANSLADQPPVPPMPVAPDRGSSPPRPGNTQ